ncbi:hypothetical protein I6F36_38295 [Bradyrhizobium sp. BRP19]|uniref:hypothetical protein n=1 Tax=unclassified Bradyrhizobium TaxID=2631580 RepID=UPI001CD3B688|nr:MULTISPECIES: hypothetical protein [unclassified Bradyrhizobium]MCA1457758.1 hypothetical protein [Bradyrhizobium sp. BRP22]MCA1552577.1 hypothetical protein [Bradyrhizobium sp. BRP19]
MNLELDEFGEPDEYHCWSPSLRAGRGIEEVLFDMINWHFDQEHVTLVEDWLRERAVAYEVMTEFLAKHEDGSAVQFPCD